MVLLNGMRISDVQTGHFNLDLPIPLEMVTSLEVLKGSGSTLYGSDAIGGVVNVRTEPFEEASELRLLTGFGNFGTNEQHAIANFATSRFSEELSAARDFADGFTYDRDYAESFVRIAEHNEIEAWRDKLASELQRQAVWRESVLWRLSVMGAN